MIRLRYNHLVPRLLGVKAIVLYPYVLFAAPKDKVTSRILRHEMVHVRQVRNLGSFRFYASYVFEYFRHLARLGSHQRAYFAISYEKEAFRLQDSIVLTADEEREVVSQNA